MLSRRTRNTSEQGPAHDRPDVFLSYSRVDKGFAEGRLTKALADHGKDVWIDVEDIRGGASDWRATVWAGIEAARVVLFVLTPDSLASTVCGEELAEAERLNKRIVPLLHGSVKGLPVPESLSKPNWVNGRPEDDFETSVRSLIDAIDFDEPWVEQHARLTQRTGEWLRHDRDGSYLLRGSDLRAAEVWLDDQAGHDEAPTTDQITYITASRRAAARRQRSLLAGVGVALLVTAVLAIVAVVQRQRAIDREKTARAQARAAQSIAALSRDPEESVRDALAAVKIRPNLPEAIYALRRAVSSADWTSILRLPDSRDIGLQDIEFSGDGSRVATGGSDGRVAIWDTHSGRLVAKARTGGAVHTVQFSPDGRQLLTASDGRYARTWDSSTGKPLHKFDTGSRSRVVWAATWGANGQRILTATLRGAEVWYSDGRRILPLSTDREGQHPGAIKMSLDGRRALTAGKNGAAWLWDLTTKRKKLLPGKDHGSRLEFTLFSRNGRQFVTSYESGLFCVWDVGRLTAPRCPPNDAPRISSTDWDLSQDGRRVLQVSYANGDVLVWDVLGTRPRQIARLPNAGSVSSAQFSRNGKYVVTGGDDGFARIWQVKPTRLVAVLHGHTRGVQRARFSPDGTQVATVSDDGSGRLWPAQPNTPDSPGWQSAESTSFSPNSRDVLVVRGARRAIWNTRSGKVVELDGGRAGILSPSSWPCGHAAGCAPWSPYGDFVAGANAKYQAVIWDARSGRVEERFGKGPRADIEAAFSPDGRHLVVVDGNRSRAQIWQVSPKAEQEQIPAPGQGRGTLSSAQFLANPQRILTVDVNGAVQISPVEGGKTATLPGAAYPAAVAATDGGRIAIGTIGGFLHVFSAQGQASPTKRATDKSVTSLEFSPTGAALALGGQTGTSSIWNLRTLEPTQLRAFGGAISGVTFSPDGNFVLVTSGATARLWDRKLRRVLVELPRTGDVRAEFSPDGSRIVIAGTKRLEVLSCVPCLPQETLEKRARSLLPAG